MLCARRGHSVRIAQRSAGASATHLCRCPPRTVGKQAAVRVKVQKVRAAANYGAPVPRKDDALEMGVSDSWVTMLEPGDHDHDQPTKTSFLPAGLGKMLACCSALGEMLTDFFKSLRWPGVVEVIRVHDPSAIPAPGGQYEGLIIDKHLLMDCGTPAALEEYLLELFDVYPNDGAAYVVYNDTHNQMMTFRVRRAAVLVDMINRAEMFLVHDPSAKQL